MHCCNNARTVVLLQLAAVQKQQQRAFAVCGSRWLIYDDLISSTFTVLLGVMAV